MAYCLAIIKWNLERAEDARDIDRFNYWCCELENYHREHCEKVSFIDDVEDLSL